MNKIESLFVSKVGVSFFNVFVLLISLFFLWGFALGLLDILNRHLQEVIDPNPLKYALVLLAYYAGYLLMPIPASLFIQKYGYKPSILLGLLFYAVGAFLFIPISHFQSFPLFILALFFIALGMAALETGVNLYTTLVGENRYSTFRLTLAQSFTAAGWFFGPIVGSSILVDIKNLKHNEFAVVGVPYVGIGVLVLFVAILILLSKLPLIRATVYNKPSNSSDALQINRNAIFQHRHFTGAVIAMAFCIIAQISLFGFFIQYLFDLFKGLEHQSVLGKEYLMKVIQFIGHTNAMNDQLYLSVASSIFTFAGFGLFAFGRFLGSFILINLKPNKVLVVTALSSIFLTIMMASNLGVLSFIAICLMTLSMSVMFPIIFTLGIRKMGQFTFQASAFLVMAIASGSFYYILLYLFPNFSAINIGIGLLLISFLVILNYGLRGYKIKNNAALD